MKRSEMNIGVFGFAVFTMALLINGTASVWADDPTAPPPSSDQSVQDRGLSMQTKPMQKSGFMNVPRYQGPRTPLPPKGGTMNFSCNMTSCTCRGDADCNNMFSSSVCGSSAVCDTTSGVECSCLRAQ